VSAPLIPARLPAKLKLIGSFAVMAILFAWIWAFTSLYDRLPQNRFVHLDLLRGAGHGLDVAGDPADLVDGQSRQAAGRRPEVETGNEKGRPEGRPFVFR
jgi:hypothetical protein